MFISNTNKAQAHALSLCTPESSLNYPSHSEEESWLAAGGTGVTKAPQF